MGPDDQPPVPHQPGHLRRGGGRGGDLRLPLRAVRRDGHAHRPRPAVPGHCRQRGGPLCRRAGQGERVRLRDVRHAVRLLGGERGDRRLAHHPRHDPRRVPPRVRRRRGGRLFHRRTDHAPRAGRRRLPDGGVPQRPLPDHHCRRGGAGLHALLRRVHAGALRGQALRLARTDRRGDAEAAPVAQAALAHAAPPHPADQHPGVGPHALPGGLHRHFLLRDRRAHHAHQRQPCCTRCWP